MASATVLSAVTSAARAEASVTLRRKYSSAAGIGPWVLSAVFLVVLWLFRDSTMMAATNASAYLLCGLLSFGVIASAVIGVSAEVQNEREDGTLLRAKSIPNGMLGHLLAKLMVFPLDAVAPFIPTLIVVSLVMPDALSLQWWQWPLLLAVYLLAAMAMLPWGAVLGSVFSSMMWLGLVMFAMYGIAAISGLFYPMTALPTWMQVVAQFTPVYWIGLGMRSVLLPESAVALEIGQSWRYGMTLVVLIAWSVAGLLLAPRVLRRMARRQTSRSLFQPKTPLQAQ